MSYLIETACLPLASYTDQYHLTLCQQGDLRQTRQRALLERFVHQRFAHTYGADVRHFMPQLLGLWQQDELQAVVGLRPAAQGPLFLEQYLDQRAEQQIANSSLFSPQREQLVEVGNMASLAPGAARLLIIALTHYLMHNGYAWVVFTGTPMLLNTFQRLALSPVNLGSADPARLGEQQQEWGSYYATRPQVMAGYIPEGLAQLEQRGLFQRLGYQAQYPLAAREHQHDCA
ncbi:MAG: thermostable hemolysin [Gammaproteobacteria bacterium HGW-Gammaproteobacteria-11]|nr:MAG: thermostable hemolysin [Gammaproteobacteria bacterium HGW-Gammaproteobacteria-11]